MDKIIDRLAELKVIDPDILAWALCAEEEADFSISVGSYQRTYRRWQKLAEPVRDLCALQALRDGKRQSYECTSTLRDIDPSFRVGAPKEHIAAPVPDRAN